MSFTRYTCTWCPTEGYIYACTNCSATGRGGNITSKPYTPVHAFSPCDCTTCSGIGQMIHTSCNGTGNLTTTHNCSTHNLWSSHYYCTSSSHHGDNVSQYHK